MTQEKLAGLLAALSGIAILVAQYFGPVSTGFGGPHIMKWWAKWVFYPLMAVVQAVALVVLLAS